MPSPRERLTLLVFTLLCVSLSGCFFKEVKSQAQHIETAGKIKGTVLVSSPQKGPVIVLRYRDENGTPVLEYHINAAENGDYQFNAAPGNYYLAAFIDHNNDGKYQGNEHGNFFGSPDIVTLRDGEVLNLETIKITGDVPKPDTEMKARSDIRKALKNLGKVTSFDDPTFTTENYSMGMWRPIDFLEQVGGGLFFLQPYSTDKIPVLFIHGSNGGPTDWKETIDSLDRQKFQPWVVYYPSGIRLNLVSEAIMQGVVTLKNKYNFKQLNVVAHSMGGLITHSFIKNFREQHPEMSKILKFVMTINSSMGGMTSAATGIKHSPVVIPAWNDVATGSLFLETIHDWSWPADIPYYLVFSYKNDSSGDGVVKLESQIPLTTQIKSSHMYGFNNDHKGTLKDHDFLNLFNQLLEDNLERQSSALN